VRVPSAARASAVTGSGTADALAGDEAFLLYNRGRQRRDGASAAYQPAPPTRWECSAIGHARRDSPRATSVETSSKKQPRWPSAASPALYASFLGRSPLFLGR
jgi:hypothetical protein